MTIENIIEGLHQLLLCNNYSDVTIKIYLREWNKIKNFLYTEYGDSEFNMERGLVYLEKQYSIPSKYNNKTLSQRQVQYIRYIHLLEDYRIHGVLTKRIYANKNKIKLNENHLLLHTQYTEQLNNSDLSKSTIGHYTSISKIFLDFLNQRGFMNTENITTGLINDYLRTLAGYSYKTVEQNICGLRHFLRYLHLEGLIKQDLASNIHMPNISKQANIPSIWTEEELRKLLDVIDRNSPIGKRDYAMILIACTLGLRVTDIKYLRVRNIDWNTKQLSIVQSKTHKQLTLPIPDAVGWAIIDYLKNGRPKYYESDIIFVKHMPPFDPISDGDHLSGRILHYMGKAGIRRDRNKHSGFHSLRHSLGSMLLEMETPLPVISTIMGHSDIDVTGIYLKTDLLKLKECVLSLEDFAWET